MSDPSGDLAAIRQELADLPERLAAVLLRPEEEITASLGAPLTPQGEFPARPTATAEEAPQAAPTAPRASAGPSFGTVAQKALAVVDPEAGRAAGQIGDLVNAVQAMRKGGDDEPGAPAQSQALATAPQGQLAASAGSAATVRAIPVLVTNQKSQPIPIIGMGGGAAPAPAASGSSLADDSPRPGAVRQAKEDRKGDSGRAADVAQSALNIFDPELAGAFSQIRGLVGSFQKWREGDPSKKKDDPFEPPEWDTPTRLQWDTNPLALGSLAPNGVMPRGAPAFPDATESDAEPSFTGQAAPAAPGPAAAQAFPAPVPPASAPARPTAPAPAPAPVPVVTPEYVDTPAPGAMPAIPLPEVPTVAPEWVDTPAAGAMPAIPLPEAPTTTAEARELPPAPTAPAAAVMPAPTAPQAVLPDVQMPYGPGDRSATPAAAALAPVPSYTPSAVKLPGDLFAQTTAPVPAAGTDRFGGNVSGSSRDTNPVAGSANLPLPGAPVPAAGALPYWSTPTAPKGTPGPGMPMPSATAPAGASVPGFWGTPTAAPASAVMPKPMLPATGGAAMPMPALAPPVGGVAPGMAGSGDLVRIQQQALEVLRKIAEGTSKGEDQGESVENAGSREPRKSMWSGEAEPSGPARGAGEGSRPVPPEPPKPGEGGGSFLSNLAKKALHQIPVVGNIAKGLGF